MFTGVTQWVFIGVSASWFWIKGALYEYLLEVGTTSVGQ